MNEEKKQRVINDTLNEIQEAVEQAEEGTLLDEIEYGKLRGKIFTLVSLEFISTEDWLKLLGEIGFAYAGRRRAAS